MLEDADQVMRAANQALLFDGIPLGEDCRVPFEFSGKIELTRKDANDLQICVTDLVEETHVLLISMDTSVARILAQIPLPRGIADPYYTVSIRPTC